ncbi:MAG: hypothetical protein ACFB22_03945 [Rhodothalassiaceae bacterium]
MDADYPDIRVNIPCRSTLVGLTDIRPHDFREVVGTEMMALDIPEEHVGAVLSQVRTSVTAKHYARHKFAREKREALDKWAVKLREIVGERPMRKPAIEPAKKTATNTQGDLFS